MGGDGESGGGLRRRERQREEMHLGFGFFIREWLGGLWQALAGLRGVTRTFMTVFENVMRNPS